MYFRVWSGESVGRDRVLLRLLGGGAGSGRLGLGRLFPESATGAEDDRECEEGVGSRAEGESSAHCDEVGEVGDTEAGEGHDPEEAESGDGGDSAAHLGGGAFLDNRMGEADDTRDAEG